MKKKILVVCASVAMLHLVVGGAVVLGGCTSVAEDEPLPRGAFIPESEKTPEEVLPAEGVQPETVVQTPVEKEIKYVESPEPEITVPAPIKEKPMKGDRPSDTTYTVQQGDSFWKIAQMYGISVAELTAYNDIDPKKLRVGQKIQIPASGKKVAVPAKKKAPAAKAAPAAKVPADGMYTVQKGDSFYKIAHKFGVKAEDIAAANNMSLTKALQINQKICIPAPGKSVKAAKTADKAAPAKQETAGTVPSIETVAPASEAAPVLPEPGLDAEAPLPPDVTLPEPAVAPTVEPAVEPAAAPAVPETPAVEKTATAAPAPVATNDASKEPDGVRTTVSEDISIEDLAFNFGTTVSKLRADNPGLPATGIIKAGTKISVLF